MNIFKVEQWFGSRFRNLHDGKRREIEFKYCEYNGKFSMFSNFNYDKKHGNNRI